MSIDLTYYGLLQISGIQSQAFLQGQLTCDVITLAEQQAILGAHCNPKGRVLSLFRIFRQSDSYFLLMPKSMLSLAMTALKKYSLFYRVELRIQESIAFTAHTQNNTDTAIYVNAPTPRYLHMNTNQDTPYHIDWHTLDLQDGIATIHPETSGKFLPHELNLHLFDGINLQKGCYTGQEIIARMHYRGKLKKTLQHMTLFSETPLLPGMDHANGIIVDVSNHPECTNEYHALILR